MSSTNSGIPDLTNRILSLSSSYSTDKEFLKICRIRNHSFITDLRKGRVKEVGASKLARIVRGTGCSGTWLLTGEGKMFPTERPAKSMAADEGQEYISDFKQASGLIERIGNTADSLKDSSLLADLTLQSSRLTTALLELQQKGHSGKGG